MALTREELDSRARDAGLVPGRTPSVAQRVDFIAGLMEDLLYDGVKTLEILAEMWGVAESTLKNASAEASRRVTGDAESARRDISAGARRLYRQAVEEGDAKGAKAIGELWALGEVADWPPWPYLHRSP